MKNQVTDVFDSYPDSISEKLYSLRQLIFDTASELGIDDIEETLKWGEPSYVTKHGSTIRITWRKSSPNEVGMFFNCKTILVDTFKEVYRDVFKFEGNRALLFDCNNDFNRDDNLASKVTVDTLKHCIELSLTYHKIKHLPMLGI